MGGISWRELAINHNTDMSSEDELVQLTKTLLEPVPTLTPKQLYRAMVIILELTASQDIDSLIDTLTLSTHVKIASFLSCLKASRLDHRAEYIAEAAKAVLGFSHVVELDLVEKTHREHREEVVLDIVGTGGDGQNTFNVSTSAAIVAAGIPGLKVCKHGGKASTSNSGSGDLINTLGVQSSKVTAETVPALWDNKFMFLLAPYFHYGFGKTSNLRKLMHIPTIFNILGPLLHPVAHVDKRVLGVYSKDLAPEYAKAASIVYPNSETFVVWGHVGLDEVSPIGKTTVWHVTTTGQVDIFELEPAMFGLQEHPLDVCKSYGPERNAEILRDDILSGKYKLGDNHPVYDYILLNTAVLYCLSQGHRNWKQGVEVANESIQSGNAVKALEHFIKDVQDL